MHMHSSVSAASSEGGVSSAWSRVAAFASAVDADLDRWLADTYRIGLTEFRALAFLSREQAKELRVNDLAQRVGLSQSSATRLVSRMEAKGVARRDVCQDDGRGVYAVITEQGEALLAEARVPYEERVREILGGVEARLPHLDAPSLGRALREIGALVSP